MKKAGQAVLALPCRSGCYRAKFGRDIQVRDQGRQRSVRRSRLPRCSLRPSLILCCGIAPFSRTPRQPRRIDRSAVPPCHPATGRVRAQRDPAHRTNLLSALSLHASGPCAPLGCDHPATTTGVPLQTPHESTLLASTCTPLSAAGD